MLSKEKIDKAKWHLSDFTYRVMGSDMREAVTTILQYVKELENKVIELEKTKEK